MLFAAPHLRLDWLLGSFCMRISTAECRPNLSPGMTVRQSVRQSSDSVRHTSDSPTHPTVRQSDSHPTVQQRLGCGRMCVPCQTQSDSPTERSDSPTEGPTVRHKRFDFLIRTKLNDFDHRTHECIALPNHSANQCFMLRTQDLANKQCGKVISRP